MLCVHMRMTPSACAVTPGFPIRTSPDQRSFDNSPELIAAYHVLHRLSTPRHPPCTLSSLTAIIRGCHRGMSNVELNTADDGRGHHADHRSTVFIPQSPSDREQARFQRSWFASIVPGPVGKNSCRTSLRTTSANRWFYHNVLFMRPPATPKNARNHVPTTNMRPLLPLSKSHSLRTRLPRPDNAGGRTI